MKLLRNLLSRVHPVCPVTAGAEGPHEYEQFVKDGVIVFEAPRSCLEFLKIGEYTPKLYEVDPNRTLWIDRYELDRIKSHKHTVQYGV